MNKILLLFVAPRPSKNLNIERAKNSIKMCNFV